MQLQKLAYYAQAWSLALRDEPLFHSRIEAWPHGPVVKELYRAFNSWKANAIDFGEGRESREASDGERRLLDAIWRGYGRFSASYLREMTHSESPWLNARGSLPENAPSDAEITPDSMRSYFRSVDHRSCARLGVTRAELNLALSEADDGPRVSWDEFKRGLSGAVAD